MYKDIYSRMQSWHFRSGPRCKNTDSISGDLIGLEVQGNYIYKCMIYTMPIFISLWAYHKEGPTFFMLLCDDPGFLSVLFSVI